MKRDFPPNYGNDYEVQWKEGDFHIGDVVACGFENVDYGIISFTSAESMSVCTACGSGTDELPHRPIHVVISNVVPIRKLEEHEYTKLDAQLRKGCQTQIETSEDEASEKSKKHVSHTLRKRIETYPLEAKSY